MESVALEWAVQGDGGVRIPGSVQKNVDMALEDIGQWWQQWCWVGFGDIKDLFQP